MTLTEYKEQLRRWDEQYKFIATQKDNSIVSERSAGNIRAMIYQFSTTRNASEARKQKEVDAIWERLLKEGQIENGLAVYKAIKKETNKKIKWD